MTLSKTIDPLRLAAAAAGQMTYLGTPCRKGGHRERFVKSGGCVVCKAESRKAWDARNQEKINLRARERYAADPTQKLGSARKWIAENPEQHRAKARAWYHANL